MSDVLQRLDLFGGGASYSEDDIEAIRSHIVDLQWKAQQAEELAEALSEAVGWNWLDDDIPNNIYDKCHGALAHYRKSKGE